MATETTREQRVKVMSEAFLFSLQYEDMDAIAKLREAFKAIGGDAEEIEEAEMGAEIAYGLTPSK